MTNNLNLVQVLVIHQILYFLTFYFHSLLASSQSAKDQRDSYCGAVSAIMAKLGVKDSDCDILEVGPSDTEIPVQLTIAIGWKEKFYSFVVLR